MRVTAVLRMGIRTVCTHACAQVSQAPPESLCARPCFEYAGETFGLAVAEFSVNNKPVFAYRHGVAKAHLQILGKKALLYHDRSSLEAQLRSFSRERAAQGSWDAYGEEYAPKRVMRRFCHVFK